MCPSLVQTDDGPGSGTSEPRASRHEVEEEPGDAGGGSREAESGIRISETLERSDFSCSNSGARTRAAQAITPTSRHEHRNRQKAPKECRWDLI